MAGRRWADRSGVYGRAVAGMVSVMALLVLNFSDNIKIHLPSSSSLLMQSAPRMTMGFVSINGSHFVDGGSAAASGGGGGGTTFYINGWNSYWLMHQSIWKRDLASEMLRRAAHMGLTVCRTWAFSDGGPTALQISPSVFDPHVFQALDFVIAEAGKCGIRLILSLVNNLNAFGGKDQYVSWAQAAGINVSNSTDSFFSHPVIKAYYKDYVKAILTRKNSINGLKYFEDPAIFAWELMNEPRCVSESSASTLQAWITEMAAYIKTLDRNHLVTVGLEGFYGPHSTERLGINPGEWAMKVGSDFINNSAIEYIDFASVHAYPDSWIPRANLDEKVKYLSQWVEAHVNDSEYILKKPVLFTEVGFSLHENNGSHDRDLLLTTVYDQIYSAAKRRQAGAGALIWQLRVEGMEEYTDEFSLVAWEHPSTFKIIVEQSCRLRHVSKGDSGKNSSGLAPCT